QRSSSFEDDKEGFLICHRGDVLNARYKVIRVLGEGTFGRVFECNDLQMKYSVVAVKVVRNKRGYSEEAHKEIEVLQHINSLDPDNTFHCVKMFEWFEAHGHVCIVFELLGLSTHDFLKDNYFRPFKMKHIRQMAYQICKAVNFLHRNKLTHTDLKPENIVLVNSAYSSNPHHHCGKRKLINPDLKIVDLGNAVYNHEHHSTVVSTRNYRAPEIILGLGWSQSCDVWSIGCILLEYYLGDMVFKTEKDREHLAMMEQVLGPLPSHMREKTRKRRYFHKGQLNWNEYSPQGRNISRHYRPLKEYMVSHDSAHINLFDLIEKMLEYDPAKRITLEEALSHPFFAPLLRKKRPPSPATDDVHSPKKK
ncbi:CLK1 kinase, partial [Rhinopomastus cyanomelas]|nr:CLK1 kinase [Rhinopomastus cyanomelas]